MNTETITNRIKEILTKLGVAFDGITVSEAAGHTLFSINTPDSGILIGTRGETLRALNHMVKKLFEGDGVDETFRFMVDVNGYHLKHIRMLEGQASLLAERARTFKYDVEMSPMSPYDRLIVHSALSNIPDIATESRGEGEVRHIVIRYTGGAASSGTQESSI